MRNLWRAPSLIILGLLIFGPLAARLAWLRPEVGFRLFSLGILTAALGSLTLGGAAAFASATGRAWRGSAVRAAALPLAVFLIVMLSNLGSLGGDHPIHDVTTDPADALQFTPDVAAMREAAPRDEVLALQAEKYPEIRALVWDESPEESFRRAEAAARAMPGWTLKEADAQNGRIEAIATSRIFRFLDDVVIQVRPEASGSRIDVRSRSQVGRSDLGANAARIAAYLAAVQADGR